MPLYAMANRATGMKTPQWTTEESWDAAELYLQSNQKRKFPKGMELPKDATRRIITAAMHMMEVLNTPKSLAIYLILRNSDYSALPQVTFDPRCYLEGDWRRARDDYQAVALLKKSDFLNSDESALSRGMDKWVEAERCCAVTNDMLRALWYDDQNYSPVKALLLKARSFIDRVLGPAPKWSELRTRFGPGATALHKRDITLPKKYSETICCTPGLLPYILDSRANLLGYHWAPKELLVVDGNTLSFVNKDFTVKRPIGTEPPANILVQLGIGDAMRTRMARYLDLDKQADTNRVFARFAYSDGLSTIDLSSASDMLASALVSILIRDDWLELMDAARSEYTTYQGKRVRLEKYSSMGNGFTFELETLIFYALAHACGAPHGLTTVFGDDIIVPRSVAPEVINLLEKCGFKVNKDKTFIDGLFFESCGYDYFQGVDIRPVYWRNLRGPSDVFHIINTVSLIAQNQLKTGNVRQIDGSPRDERFRRIFDNLSSMIKTKHTVPVGFENAGIVGSFDQARPAALAAGLCGFSFRALKFQPTTWKYSRSLSGYVMTLHRPQAANGHELGDPSPSDAVSVRGRGEWSVGRYSSFGGWSGTGAWL